MNNYSKPNLKCDRSIFYQKVSTENVLSMSEMITLTGIKRYCISNPKLSSFYKSLLIDIFHSDMEGHVFSDGYDIVQDVACILFANMGKSLDDIIGVTKYKKPMSLLKACYAEINRQMYDKLKHDQLLPINDEICSKVIYEEENTESIDKVYETISKLNLTTEEYETLNLYISGFGTHAIARILEINRATVWLRRKKIQNKYVALIR